MPNSASIYDTVKKLLEGQFKSQYSRVKAAMNKARDDDDPDEYHRNREELQKLRERVIRLINENDKKNNSKNNTVNKNQSRNNTNKINALKEEYVIAKKAQEEARLSGNVFQYGNLRARVNLIKEQIIKEKANSQASNQTAMINSAEENRIALSGSEPIYTPKLWNTKKGKGNNNCYSYAMNNFSADRPVKAVPGDRSGYNHDLDYKSCKNIHMRLLSDNPDSIYPEKPENSCIAGFSKIMMFVGERETNAAYGDFHFYKHHKDIEYEVQDQDTIESIAKFLETDVESVIKANNNKTTLQTGSLLMFKNYSTKDGSSLWSHKLGWATGALLTDACGKVIKDPRLSCRKFSTIDYKKYCGAYCIRNAIAKSS